MIFNLVKNETGLGELHKLAETFFSQLATASSFDQIKFPDWYIPVFGATQLNDRFKDVFDAYKELTEDEQRKVLTAVQDTNRVCDLCKKQSDLKPARLKEFPKDFQQPLEKLFIHLWKNALPNKKFADYFSSDLSTYINEFIAENGHIEVCPFCALESFINISGQSRIEIDHWLCKELYPHLAVNFENLVPIGDKCNPSPVKGHKDVLVSLKTHGRVYYPYCRHEGISVIFNFINEPTVTNNIEKKDWELIIKPNNPQDTDLVESWKDIFNIQQRYEEIIKDCVFKTWEIKYAKRFPDAVGDIAVFKENLLSWKETFDLKEQPSALLYRAFLDYLTERASDKYLQGLCSNFASSVKALKSKK